MPNLYESDQALSEYLLMHYGTDAELMPWPFGPADAIGFPSRTVSHLPNQQVSRGLDIGCAVGRSSFELSKICDQVIGIDYSASFIEAANEMRLNGNISYRIKESGQVGHTTVARIPKHSQPENIQFLCADAMNLPDDLGQFDYVHAANLICRLPDPALLLKRLPSLVATGGYLVLATPCTWLNEFTPPENQPSNDTFAWLSELLSTSFKLVKKKDEPFLIRETARKFQWSVSMVTLWQRL
ncbi:MAG: putative 4-mercaptohistidine N1-methyltransferase [Akkermansiaceae bacterium]